MKMYTKLVFYPLDAKYENIIVAKKIKFTLVRSIKFENVQLLLCIKYLLRGESNSPDLYNFCVRQFM